MTAIIMLHMVIDWEPMSCGLVGSTRTCLEQEGLLRAWCSTSFGFRRLSLWGCPRHLPLVHVIDNCCIVKPGLVAWTSVAE